MSDDLTTQKDAYAIEVDEAARLAADRLAYPGARSGRDVVLDYAERVGHLRYDREDDDE